MPSHRSTEDRKGLTLCDVVRHVATAVKKAINAAGGTWTVSPMPPYAPTLLGSHAQSYTVRFEDIVLLELKKVSKGSWQPILAFYVSPRA